MRASSARMVVSVRRVSSEGSPVAMKLSLPSPRPLRSTAAGPGVFSWIGHRRGETTSTGCRRMSVAEGVEEAVDGRAEGAQAQQVEVDQVDPDLEADQVRRGVAHGARDERVEHGAAAEAQVDQLDAPEPGGVRRPGRGGALGVGPVADRAAVVQPHPATRPGHGRDRCIGAQGDQLGDLVVRQPDLDVLRPARQAGEPERLHRTRLEGRGTGRHVDGADVAAERDGPAGEPAVDEQVVDPGGTGRRTW